MEYRSDNGTIITVTIAILLAVAILLFSGCALSPEDELFTTMEGEWVGKNIAQLLSLSYYPASSLTIKPVTPSVVAYVFEIKQMTSQKGSNKILTRKHTYFVGKNGKILGVETNWQHLTE